MTAGVNGLWELRGRAGEAYLSQGLPRRGSAQDRWFMQDGEIRESLLEGLFTAKWVRCKKTQKDDSRPSYPTGLGGEGGVHTWVANQELMEKH